VWIGRPPFAATALILDARGHIVRARLVRDRATKVYEARGEISPAAIA
jgi:hypothetical protein